jgi:hypothetical protein
MILFRNPLCATYYHLSSAWKSSFYEYLPYQWLLRPFLGPRVDSRVRKEFECDAACQNRRGGPVPNFQSLDI